MQETVMTILPPPPEPKPISDAVAMAYGIEDFVYFDIETIPDQSPDALKKCREKVTPPGNIKKPESIEKWMDENGDEAAKTMLEKTSFDGGRGHVCTIGWARNDGSVEVRHAESRADEAGVIRDFFKSFGYKSETIVGHNILGFDVPFLLKRAVVLGVELPSDRVFPRDPKPWSNGVFDTMTAWAGARDMISMNALCGILGIVGKDGFDGSMVAEAWANGEHETIARYCDDDVRRTRAIHQKFLEAGF
jgi:DNA polymerase elongation subunit (family B)